MWGQVLLRTTSFLTACLRAGFFLSFFLSTRSVQTHRVLRFHTSPRHLSPVTHIQAGTPPLHDGCEQALAPSVPHLHNLPHYSPLFHTFSACHTYSDKPPYPACATACNPCSCNTMLPHFPTPPPTPLAPATHTRAGPPRQHARLHASPDCALQRRLGKTWTEAGRSRCCPGPHLSGVGGMEVPMRGGRGGEDQGEEER